MMDLLPFLRLSGKNAESKIADICDYLNHLKETLEFVLMNISFENLSVELADELKRLGSTIIQDSENNEDAFRQLSSKAVTVSGVCASEMFKNAVKAEIDKYMSATEEESGNEIEADNSTNTDESIEAEGE